MTSRWAKVSVVALASAVGALVALQPIAVLLPVAALFAVLLVGRPQRAAVVVVALIFSNGAVIAVNQQGAPGAMTAVVPMLLVITIAHAVLVQRRGIVIPQATVWLVAFLVVQILGVMMSRDAQDSSTALSTFFFEGFCVYLLLVNAIRSLSMLRNVLLALVFAAGALGALTLFQEATGTNSSNYGGFSQMSKAVINRSDPDGGRQRHAGPIGEQNRWAQSLAMVLPIGLALAFTDRSRTVRAACLVATLGIVSGVVLTYSRGSVVGIAITLAVATALGWVRPRVSLMIAVVAVVGLSLFAPSFVGRASTLFASPADEAVSPLDAPGPDGSVTNRTTEARAAIAVFIRHPVVGVGPGEFPTYFQDEARRLGAARIVGVNREAHSLYLGLAAETGLLGLISFGGVIVATLRPLGALRRRCIGVRGDVAGMATGLALAVVTYLSTGLFLHFAYVRYFWLVVALAGVAGVLGQSVATEDEDGPVEVPAPRRAAVLGRA